MKKTILILLGTSLYFLFSSAGYASEKRSLWEIDDLLTEVEKPYVMGHRGYGENLDPNAAIPIENTIKSVVRAFEEGVAIVEVDVTVTADGKAVLLHDDYLSDYTCVNTLTYDQLKERLPYVPKLSHVLHVAKKFARKSEHVSGLVNIEVKSAAPFCDVNDSSELALASSVIKAVKNTKMQNQVVIESFSPALLALFATEAADLKRNLTLNILQLLAPEVVEAATGLPVTLIDKQAGYGLQWAEIGSLFRLPGYRSLDEYIGVAYQLGAKFLTMDKLVFFQAEHSQHGSASYLVNQAHQLGFEVLPYTVDTVEEWQLLKSFGADGIITNNIPMALNQ